MVLPLPIYLIGTYHVADAGGANTDVGFLFDINCLGINIPIIRCIARERESGIPSIVAATRRKFTRAIGPKNVKYTIIMSSRLQNNYPLPGSNSNQKQSN